jgi:hypothetical protein
MIVSEFLKSKTWEEVLKGKQVIIKSNYYNIPLVENRLDKNQVDIGNKEIKYFFIIEKEKRVDVYV